MSVHTQPPITVTTMDYERIERLIESDACRALPAAQALERELQRANVVEPQQLPAGVVSMNSTVRFVEEGSGARHEMTLVYPDAAGAPDTVSILAPVGSALLGLAVGQSIQWPMPAGRVLRLRILEVITQPEAMGQYSR